MSNQPTGETFGPLGALKGLLMELAFPFLCSWSRFVVGFEQARASGGNGLLAHLVAFLSVVDPLRTGLADSLKMR